MSSLLTTAKVSINIGNCKLYARKSDDFIDKWIVIRKMILKKVKQRLTFFVVAKKIQQTVSAVFAF